VLAVDASEGLTPPGGACELRPSARLGAADGDTCADDARLPDAWATLDELPFVLCAAREAVLPKQITYGSAARFPYVWPDAAGDRRRGADLARALAGDAVGDRAGPTGRERRFPEAGRERAVAAHGRERAVAAARPSPLAPFVVAVNWAGSNLHAELERRRRLPLALFERLSAVPGVVLVSVQSPKAGFIAPRAGPGGRRALPDWLLVVDGLDAGDAFRDTAAVLRASRLAVSSDTSVAHLAGAMGVETWLLLPAWPHSWWFWRGPEGDRTEWYPSVRLWRQPPPTADDAREEAEVERMGEGAEKDARRERAALRRWAPVFAGVEAELRGRVGA
jgi:hypothetical protein